MAAGENASVKIEGGGGKDRYLYIVKIEIFHPVLTSFLSTMYKNATFSLIEIFEPAVLLTNVAFSEFSVVQNILFWV